MLTNTAVLTAIAMTTADTPPSSEDMFWDTIYPGALGGLFLALGRFLITWMRLMNTPDPKFRQFLLLQIPVVLILPLLGGGLAWVTNDIRGAFLTGLGALGFILIAAGEHGHVERQEGSNASPNS